MSAAELFPANVMRIEALGVAYNWRRQDHDIKVECPVCGNVLLLHEKKPWHYCGWPTCHAWMKSFEEIIDALDRAHRLESVGRAGKNGGTS
jgi:peptide methionine sulfoxide reductase MsrB